MSAHENNDIRAGSYLAVAFRVAVLLGCLVASIVAGKNR